MCTINNVHINNHINKKLQDKSMRANELTKIDLFLC